MANIIQKSIHRLLSTEPFYAHYLLNSRILYDRFGVPTAGAAVLNGVPTFIFNSEFMGKLTLSQCTTILKHEVLHILFDHTANGETMSMEDKYISNLATDCTINQYLENLPDGCVTLDVISKLVEHDLQAFQTSDYYFDHMKKKQKEMMESGLTTLDEHDLVIPGEEIGNAQMNKAAANAVAKKALGQAAGNLNSNLVSVITTHGEASLPWKQILRNFIMSQITNTTLNTHKKVNRRFAMPVPGKKKKRTMTLGVCTDSSGSVSDEQYAMFLTEIKSITKQVELTWFIQADCEVQKVEKLTRNTKALTTRAGNGGTAYQPAITKARELKCDVIIYFGDFDSADVPENPGVPFLWVGVGNQKPPANFGKVLRLGK